jgi:hypothetical protein
MDRHNRAQPLNIVVLKEKEQKGQVNWQMTDFGVLESLMVP